MTTAPSRRRFLTGALALAASAGAGPLWAQGLDAEAIGIELAAAMSPSASAERLAAFWRDRLSETARRNWSLPAFEAEMRGIAELTGGVELLAVRSVSEGLRAQLSFQLRSHRQGVTRWLRSGPDPDQPNRLFALADLPYPAMYDRDGPSGPVSRSELAGEVERRVRYAVERDEFSGAVQVAAPDGETVWEGAFGSADRETGRLMTLETPITIASADKSFTALMVGRLIRQGRLAFDTRLIEVLPDYPNAEFARACTIQHLLTHSSGLGGLFERPRYDGKAPYSRMADLFPAFAAEPPAFAPGAQAAYSNEGFIVLGAVIEAISSESWYDLLEQQIYAPAGMRSSAHYRRDEADALKAKGYLFSEGDRFGFDRVVPNDAFIGYRGSSCGGGYSTVGDMTRYLQALRTGRLMPAEQLAQFVAEQPGGLYGYGRGFSLQSAAGRTLIGHSGGGARSGMDGDHRMVWETGWSVSILGNRDAPFSREISRDIGHWLALQDG